MSNDMDPDQDRRFVGPDLNPKGFDKYFQQTKKVAASKDRVK